MNRTRRKRTFVAIAGLVAALVAVGVFAGAGAAANGVSVSRIPVSFTLFNPCTDENVHHSGTALVVIDPTSDSHGLRFHSVDVALEGVGETTATRYLETFTVTISIQGTEDTSDNGSFAETNVVHSRVIAPGPGNDLVFGIVFHFTINANGEVVGWHNFLTLGDCV
jgi:hypothetical protein